MGRIAGVQNKLTTEAKDKLGFIESFRSTFVYLLKVSIRIYYE